MYHSKTWDEDKWNIHSHSYNSSKYGSGSPLDKDEKKYHEPKYGSKDGDVSSDYMKKEDSKEKDEKKKDEMFEDAEEKKENAELKEEDIQFKAAKQVFAESKNEQKKIAKKDINGIEEAIKKAIEDEKKIILMDK